MTDRDRPIVVLPGDFPCEEECARIKELEAENAKLQGLLDIALESIELSRKDDERRKRWDIDG